MYQLHEGMPEHGVARVTNATIFESNAATIAPLQNPSQAVKQPIATRRPRETSSRPSPRPGGLVPGAPAPGKPEPSAIQYAASRRAAATTSAVCGST